jgi:hypothetical protein
MTSTGFELGKKLFCLGDYEFLRDTAVERYLHLVMIAQHLLTHLAIDRTGAKAIKQGRDALRLPGVERMQSVLRGMLFDNCVASVTDGKKDNAIARKLRNMVIAET